MSINLTSQKQKSIFILMDRAEIEKGFKDSIQKAKNAGLFSLAIIFSLIVGVGGNVFYEWIVKPNPILGLAFLAAAVGTIFAFILEIRHSSKIISRAELGLKVLKQLKENEENSLKK